MSAEPQPTRQTIAEKNAEADEDEPRPRRERREQGEKSDEDGDDAEDDFEDALHWCSGLTLLTGRLSTGLPKRFLLHGIEQVVNEL